MDILSRPAPTPDHRVTYGSELWQFGDLWIPETAHHAHLPLVVFFHGGWWKSEYDLGYAGHLCRALKNAGIATWSVEYRRVGETGGGWPNTFLDAAAGLDFVKKLADRWPLDVSRVISMGHSAGGHLAFWAAGRRQISPLSEIFKPPQVSLIGAVALAGAVDLRLTIELSGDSTFAHDKEEVYALLGGKPSEVPERYGSANPGDLLAFGIPQILVQGTADDQIPPQLPSRWAELSRRMGDSVVTSIIPDADHFDVVDPESHAWATVLHLVRKALSL